MKTKKIIEVLEFIDDYCNMDCESCVFDIKSINECHFGLNFMKWSIESLKEELKDIEEL